jgi:8-oxo-dGTP diphosphatase/2-hydroxy-dATP diphosphatase
MNSNKKIYTLVMIQDGPRMLLGKKKRGLGASRWNGFGGKVEDGESVEDGARRELFEECGIKVSNIYKIGVNNFSWVGKDGELEVHVFKANDVLGNPIETDEMSPQWFFVDEIPFGEMWPDDVYWFPYLMKDRKIIIQRPLLNHIQPLYHLRQEQICH